jgi:osmotically-inducible protein OsmY
VGSAAGSAIAPAPSEGDDNMKKTLASLVVSVFLFGALGCSNWNRMTPKPLDNTAIESEVRKNLAGDGITGLSINVDNGVVTLSGSVKSSADRDKARNDAAKVNGVTRVVNRLTVGS